MTFILIKAGCVPTVANFFLFYSLFDEGRKKNMSVCQRLFVDRMMQGVDVKFKAVFYYEMMTNIFRDPIINLMHMNFK
jgi:hypothetical protein